MPASVAFINQGGRRGCRRLVMVGCDAEDGCAAQVTYSDRESYLEAGHAGWRRVGTSVAEAKFYCPAHATTAAAGPPS